MTIANELTEFLDAWTDNGSGCRDAFTRLYAHLAGLEHTRLEWRARPGISYSLRAVRESQKQRPLFAMVDVIDDDPADRWLSICFYEDMIHDPDEEGDHVPGGLLGENAVCFDVENDGGERIAAITTRMDEAHSAAGKA